MSVSSYALIKDGVVINAVLWNGEGDLFPEYENYEIKEEDQVGPGFTAEKDKKGSWVLLPRWLKSPRKSRYRKTSILRSRNTIMRQPRSPLSTSELKMGIIAAS